MTQPQTQTATLVVSPAGTSLIRQPSFQVDIRQGPARGQSQQISLPRFQLGSSEAAHVRIADPTVSALHCEIICDLTGLRVRDLGSKNGVQVGGHRVTEAWLAPQDELQLGDCRVGLATLGEFHERTLPSESTFGKLVGSSHVMRDLYGTLEKLAGLSQPVLILGETGSGKELAAEALVQHGPRASGPLVVVNCAGLLSTLAESELFGHERGAFTGAQKLHRGAFERANGGTLFLDELGELPLELQSRFLRALETGQVTRVGGSKPLPVDVRVLAATHRELGPLVNRGLFRADLYYRLAALVVRMPPLREHREDIPALVGHFLNELRAQVPLAPQRIQQLYDAEYPGNVRELRNAVVRAVAGLEEAERSLPGGASSASLYELDTPYRIQKERMLGAYERGYLEVLLKACGGNVSEAARRSGLNRVHLYELLSRRGISRH